MHSLDWQTLRQLYFIYLDHRIKTGLISANKAKLKRRFRSHSCWMVTDGGTLDILSAGVRRKGGEEGGDSLYLWEVTVNFAIFEEIIQNYQQLP